MKTILVLACLLSLAATPAIYLSPPGYFVDLEVTETVTRRRLTEGEIMELLDRLPNVKAVRLHIDPPWRFAINRLAYPQYEEEFMLSEAEWTELQAYCKERLTEGDGVEQVRKHQLAIVAGTPPFGLKIKGRK